MTRFAASSYFLLAATLSAASLTTTLTPGNAQIKSAGPISFGPEGILFVGDPMGAQLVALSTGDLKPAKAVATEMKDLNEKIAAMLGTSADQIIVNDMAVNPVSHLVYFSVSRGKGPDAAAVIVHTTRDGKLAELNLTNIPHSNVALPKAPAADAKDRRGTPVRMETITDLAYIDGEVVVAGLSNEEFSSTLRSFAFPFQAAPSITSVEIYHGNHGRFETNSPIRTFTHYTIDGKPHILAAYTCTPLVKFPMSDLKSSKKVTGTTIAELGNRNRPLDMIVYKKGGTSFILMNNSSRGVMKIQGENLGSFPSITKQTEVTGVPYETIASLKGVEHLDRLDENRALLLVRQDSGALSLQTIALP